MKIEWMIIAEGFATNGSGAITAIGVDQIMIITPILPITTKRAVMVHVVADDESFADKELGLAIKVLSPSGQVLAAQTAPAKAGPRQWADIPVTFDIFTEFPLRLTEFGTYVVDIEVSHPDGMRVQGQTDFYVREPLDAEGNVPTPRGS